MSKEELNYLTEKLAAQERDLVLCRQAMINFSAMLRDNGFNPAILEQGSEEIEHLIEAIYIAIKEKLPRIQEENVKDKRIQELVGEIYRLKHRTLLQRILNR